MQHSAPVQCGTRLTQACMPQLYSHTGRAPAVSAAFVTNLTMPRTLVHELWNFRGWPMRRPVRQETLERICVSWNKGRCSFPACSFLGQGRPPGQPGTTMPMSYFVTGISSPGNVTEGHYKYMGDLLAFEATKDPGASCRRHHL